MLNNFAEDLKALRESKNITLEEIAAQTRVRISIFEKLESGDFSFQPPTYIRAFIKQYAKAIDEEPELILKDYDDARAGKYKKKFTEEKNPLPEKAEPKDETINDTSEKVELETTEKTGVQEEPENILPKKLPASQNKTEKIRKTEEVEDKSPEDYYDGSLISSSLLKKISFYIIGVAFLVGVYFMIQTLFFDDGSDEPEIIRQRGFNEVVEENERRILGKRTEEEIQDSIRRAQEQLMMQTRRDSLELEVIAKGSGRIFVAIDSLNINDPRTYNYVPGDTGLYYAKHFFHFGVNDPTTIDVFLNDRKLELPERRFRNLLIDSTGIRQQGTQR